MTHFLRFLAAFLAAVAVTGCGSVYVVPEDIEGTIVDITKTPWPGKQVLVGDTSTTTDESGHFTVHDVTPPYDLALASYTTVGDVYVGMSDPAPTVVSRGLAPGSPALSGSMSLTVVLPAADTSTVVGWVLVEATDNMASFSLGPVTTAPGPARTFRVDWVGPPSAGIRIHAFQTQVDPATSALVHYLGYDTTDLVFDGQSDVTWTASYKPPPFSESPLSVTVSLPEGFPNSSTGLLVRSPGMLGSAGHIGNVAGTKASLVVPDLPGATFTVNVIASDADDYSLSVTDVAVLPAGTQTLAVQVEPAPTLISPPEGGTVGAGSTIAWTLGGPGAPYTALSAMDGKGPNFVLWIGEDGAVTVPDLSALGLPLPHGAAYFVAVDRASSAITVEDFASRAYLSPQRQEPSASLALSASKQVTTP